MGQSSIKDIPSGVLILGAVVILLLGVVGQVIGMLLGEGEISSGFAIGVLAGIGVIIISLFIFCKNLYMD